MFSKQILSCGTRYIETFIPSSLKRKCANLKMTDISIRSFNLRDGNCFKESYCSSSKSSSENQSPASVKQVINNEERARLEKWIEMVRYEGGRVPNKITENELLELREMTSEFQRLKYLNYLMKREYDKGISITRKEKMKKEKIELKIEKKSRPKGHIEYGLWRNSMFAKSSTFHFKSLLNNRLVNAMQHGQPLLIDLGFYDYMEGREVNSLANQLSLSIMQNRLSSEPFDLTFCNVDFNCKKFKVLPEKYMSNILKPTFPMNITSSSYLDLFPKKQLVYLTCDAKDRMKTYDPNAIYIIGGFVDLQRGRPFQLAKAKRDGIKPMRFPVEKYHILKSGIYLPIHVMVNILLDLQKYDGDFKKAFLNIPKRFLETGDERHNTPYQLKRKF